MLVAPLAQPLSTAEVYAEADRLGLPRSAEELAHYREALRAALASGAALPPAELLVNDLEAAARSLCPAIDESLARVRESDADATLLSGSGPTVLGLFAGADGPSTRRAAPPPRCATNPDRRRSPRSRWQAAFGAPGALLSQFRNSA